MEHSILNQLFRQVDAGIDTKDKILIMIPTEESLLATRERELSQKSFGMGQLDRNGRQRTTKKTGVVLVETGLYVRDGRNHRDVLWKDVRF